jgi:photosynthetic reaction center cytochrome c subunit
MTAYVVSTLTVLLVSFAARSSSAGGKAQRQEKSQIQITLKEPTGAERCVYCHPSEVQGFARSAMAHALRRPGQEPSGVVSADGSKITMHSNPAGFWQSWENGGEQSDYHVDYVIGSGEHASGYLVNLGGHLFQSPVAYYKRRQGYDLAPGYEHQPDPDFTRPVSVECVLCHSGTPLHVPGTLNEYRTPAFVAEGITCERCHGPAEKHLADPRAGTIINPAKLERNARDSICEQCHLFGVARVPNPGKQISDFVPGRPLEETFTIYRNVMPEGMAAGDFKVISHVEQLAVSTCVRKSEGRLWCGTCHNPHEKLQTSVEYYRSKCLDCHTAQFPAAHPGKESDCLSCHMPKRDAKDGGHTVFTDHRIQRVPDAPRELPANSGIAAWREPTTDLQKRNLGIAYIDVGMQRHSAEFVIQGYRDLTEVQRQFANDSALFRWIGEALLLGKQTTDAKLAFERALQLDGETATGEASLASAFMQEGANADAIEHLERAVNLDPLFLPAASTLIELYAKEGKAAEAEALSAKIRTAMNQRGERGGDGAVTTTGVTGKPAEEVFKNIQVLKGVAADQVIPGMQFIASALGVECSYCHVAEHFEKDDKKAKRTAREMMRMMVEINEQNFGSQRKVTCYTCHRGAPTPAGTPSMGGNSTVANANGDHSTTATPIGEWHSPNGVVKRYVEALGGAEALQKITSRVEKGMAELGGKAVPVTVFTEAPQKWAMVRQLAEGENRAIFDGKTGWFEIPGQPVREMHGPDVEAAEMDGDLQFALHIQDVFPELRTEYPESVDGREMDVLLGVGEGELRAKFYFDEESGLLVRMIRYGESPFGLNPTQLDYADYRELDGVQVPFRVTVTKPGSRTAIEFEQVRQNVKIDKGVFVRRVPVPH